MIAFWNELSDRKFKITIINMLITIEEKVDGMKKQRQNISEELERLQKNQ